MNAVALEDILYAWITATIAPTVAVWMDQNAPRPAGGFVGMRHNAERALGSNGYKSSPAGELDTVTVTQDVEFMWMLTGYGDAGAAAIYKVFDDLQLPTRRNDLSVAGIAFISHDGIMNVPEVVNSRTEARRALDCRMRIGNVLTYSSTIVEHADIRIVLKEDQRTVRDELVHI